MRVAPSAYYAARTRALSARSVRDEALMRVMRQVWEENYCVFGVRKMHAFSTLTSWAWGTWRCCTVERLMRRMGYRGVSRLSDPPCHGFSAAPCMPLGPGQSAFRGP